LPVNPLVHERLAICTEVAVSGAVAEVDDVDDEAATMHEPTLRALSVVDFCTLNVVFAE
jgi:hypothetical protein